MFTDNEKLMVHHAVKFYMAELIECGHADTQSRKTCGEILKKIEDDLLKMVDGESVAV
jgi:hypothetical protein